jgi:hypothetical protein
MVSHTSGRPQYGSREARISRVGSRKRWNGIPMAPTREALTRVQASDLWKIQDGGRKLSAHNNSLTIDTPPEKILEGIHKETRTPRRRGMIGAVQMRCKEAISGDRIYSEPKRAAVVRWPSKRQRREWRVSLMDRAGPKPQGRPCWQRFH